MPKNPDTTSLRRRGLLAVAGALPFGLPPLAARAEGEAWPTRLITIVEGYPAGGVTDIVSRVVAERMARELGQTIVVDNRPGAATSVATTGVSRARPDGYTFGMGTTTLAINPTFQPNLTPREPMRELAPVGMVFRTAFILHVRPDFPARTVAELIAYAKANPGKVSWGSSGIGAVNHLALEHFKAQAGVDITHVPYRMGNAAMMDMQQGRIDALFQAVQEATPSLRANLTRGMAVTLLGRDPGFPELPPVADALPSFGEVTFWQGLFAPPETPAPIIAKAGAALAAATGDATLRARMAEQSVELVSGNADVLRQTLAADTARWGELVRRANIRPD